MAFSIDDLRTLLDLEYIEHNIFRARSVDIGSGSVFGGQALAQSLVAAHRTLDDQERAAHSMHGYFILPGDVDAPIVYEVDRLRDGRTFATRRIVAIQHGRAIFNMAVSFQSVERGPEHQGGMPDVPPPTQVPRERDLLKQVESRIPSAMRRFYLRERPIEFRPINPVNPFDPKEEAPQRSLWLRARGTLNDDALLHQSVLAYASDYGLLGTALRPHALSFLQPNLQAATLDHALWFHRSFRVDDWLLYTMDSPSASGARGFTRGQIFTQDGTLVASVAQEGLMRVHDSA